MNLSSFQTRIRIVAGCVFLFAALLILKLFLVQVVHQNQYAQRADHQYATPLGNLFARGDIFFTKQDGTIIPAATIESGFKIALDPQKITDVGGVYGALAPYLPPSISHDNFITRASNKLDTYEEVIHQLSKEVADKITALHLSGVTIYQENWRFYPGNSLASHAIGFMSFTGNNFTGQYGLEKYYNTTLTKTDNKSNFNFFAEVFSDIGDTFSSTRQGNIVTTIEPSVQQDLEEQLNGAMTEWHADEAGGIIMDPQTGEIYAMASLPDFDLNQSGNVNDPLTYNNSTVQSVFEFGSVMKPLVMAGALDAGVVTPQTTYNDKGSVVVDKQTISNFDKKGRGPGTTMQTVLDQSLNTGMVFVAGKMGHDMIRTDLKSYGISTKTGIDLPGETSGLINNLNSPRDIEYATAAFGQGIALTPIEAIRAFSSLANGGTLVTPHLVQQIRYDDGTSNLTSFPPSGTLTYKKATYDTITQMLVHVYDNYGNGSYKMPNYSIAAKTGTAQVALPTGKGYYKDEHMHSFFAYFPAYNPRFIVFLYLKNPKNINYASQTLLPRFVQVSKFLLNYYNIPPDR